MVMQVSKVFCLFVGLAISLSAVVYAQDDQMPSDAQLQQQGATLSPNIKPKQEKKGLPDVRAENMPSLFLEPQELALIHEAQMGFTNDGNGESGGNNSVVGGNRFISVSGLLYKNPQKWVVWVNGMRITPQEIPPEIIDIRVGSEIVRIKWYDRMTNKIYNVRLRVHQKYNIDSGLILPG